MPDWNFEQVKKEARQTWNKELNKIQVEGGTETEQVIFYTALYHAMIHPNVYMDVDGKYRSTNGKVYTAHDFVNYTNFSLWDTFRALHPLYTIINQKLTVDFIRTFLERYDHTGRMLIMEFNNEEGEMPPMIAHHSLSVVADAYEKGIRDFDVQKALQAMVKLANDPIRPKKEFYLQYGFIPSDFKGQSVSNTLEFCYNDWCITRLAKDLDNDIEKSFSQRGNFYKNVFSPEVNFMRGRRSNFKFVDNFDPEETINHYTEANAYHYSTFVPHDMNGLIELMGGDKVFEAWLDSCFSVEADFSRINLRDVTGLIGQYAHGNEPSHHIAYLYNYVGLPWKTQGMVRRILTEMYKNQQDGIEGNEDCGQMSAWYVMSAMGLYSVTPGLDYYVIGSPVFDKITINLENGNKFKIIAKNNGPKNIYIQSAMHNEGSYSKSYLRHSDIIKGGTLVFEMGDSPNKGWGEDIEDRPVAANNKFKFAASPDIEFSDVLFLDSREVNMSVTEPNSTIYYTLDGAEPTSHSNPYQDPIVISKPTTLKIVSFTEGKNPSYPITVHFKQIEMLDAVNVADLKPGIKYLYREGPQIRSAKDQSEAPILDTGVLKTFNVDAIKDSRPFGYNLSGYLKVPENAPYTLLRKVSKNQSITTPFGQL
jgi:predicted alpha-1,2-mannosidase